MKEVPCFVGCDGERGINKDPGSASEANVWSGPRCIHWGCLHPEPPKAFYEPVAIGPGGGRVQQSGGHRAPDPFWDWLLTMTADSLAGLPSEMRGTCIWPVVRVEREVQPLPL